MTTITRYFYVSDKKPSAAIWTVDLNIAGWLGSTTISNVDYSAKRLDTGDVVASVLGTPSEVGTHIYPVLQAGVSGISYLLAIEVTASNGDKDTFYIQWTVYDR